MVVSQAESPFYELERQQSLLRILGEVFDRVNIYNYTNLTYPGGLWSFTLAVNGDRCPIGDFDPQRVEDSGLEFQWYSAAMHRSAFVLPAFQARALAEHLTPL